MGYKGIQNSKNLSIVKSRFFLFYFWIPGIFEVTRNDKDSEAKSGYYKQGIQKC